VALIRRVDCVPARLKTGDAVPGIHADGGSVEVFGTHRVESSCSR
jgi:hypothetical protein